MKFILGLASLAFLLIALPAIAQNHENHAAQSAKTDIYQPAMRKMHDDMMIEASGNPDIDFVKGMIPHHQGAIDLAKILKEHGKDPELQELADDIIDAQEKEIAFMQDWLKKNGK